MIENGKQLILFAWAIEGVGVVGGMLNSAYTTFGNELPTTFPAGFRRYRWSPFQWPNSDACPLTSVFYHRHKLIQGVAILGILALGYLAVENWSFGFERIVDLRLKPVNIASRDWHLRKTSFQRCRTSANRRHKQSQKRDELRRVLSSVMRALRELTAQLSKEADTHQGNLQQIRDACRLIRETCMVPRSQAEDLRYQDAVDRLNAELERQREDRKNLQAQIDALVTTDANDSGAIDLKIAAAEAVVTEKREALRRAYDGNQSIV